MHTSHRCDFRPVPYLRYFFFNDTATTEIYTLSLHDALPISFAHPARARRRGAASLPAARPSPPDRKSTRLNSSHVSISYAVFCLKKKTNLRPHISDLFPYLHPNRSTPLESFAGPNLQ